MISRYEQSNFDFSQKLQGCVDCFRSKTRIKIDAFDVDWPLKCWDWENFRYALISNTRHQAGTWEPGPWWGEWGVIIEEVVIEQDDLALVDGGIPRWYKLYRNHDVLVLEIFVKSWYWIHIFKVWCVQWWLVVSRRQCCVCQCDLWPHPVLPCSGIHTLWCAQVNPRILQE